MSTEDNNNNVAVPEDRKEACVGPSSEMAGKAAACQGCPNAQLCASGAGRKEDPDVPLIAARLKGIKLRLMILSGKGGVGKSTVTKELALALGRRGLEVGVMDADLCGPSQPRMLGVRSEEIHNNAAGISPVSVREGVSMMSIHFLMGDEQKNDAITWRGPQKNGTLKQFLKGVNWQSMSGSDRPLDCLLVDTPPGTTDEHITLATILNQVQKIHEEEDKNTGEQGVITKTCAIVVTTPQEVAVNDVRRELTFCQKAKVPVLGLVVNMDGFVCPCCKKMSQIFPNESTTIRMKKVNAADALAQEFNIPILGRLPLDPDVMLACEAGVALCEHEDEKAQKVSQDNDHSTNNNNTQQQHEPLAEGEESPAVIAVEDMVDKIMDLCDL